MTLEKLLKEECNGLYAIRNWQKIPLYRCEYKGECKNKYIPSQETIKRNYDDEKFPNKEEIRLCKIEWKKWGRKFDWGYEYPYDYEEE